MSYEISNNLRKLVENKFDMSKAIQRAQMKATLMITNTGKEYAPYLTGALRKSITYDVSKIANGITIVGSPLPYAELRHWINKKNPHTIRYLERAYYDNEDYIRFIFREELKKG